MPSILSLTKARDEASAAVAKATTEKARAKAIENLETASLALAALQSRTDSKMVKTVKKTSEEKYEEDEDESEEADEEADDEPKKPASDDEDDSDDDDDDSDDDDDDDSDDDESEDEEEDEEEDAEEEEDEKCRASALASAKSLLRTAKGPKAQAAAKAHLDSVKRAIRPRSASKHKALLSACERVTGKKGLSAIVGALDALKKTAENTERLSTDVAKIKQRQRREKVDAMLTAARREGKVSKAEVASLRSQGLKDSRWLKAHLEVLPKKVRLQDEGALQGKGSEAPTSHDAAFDAQGMSDEQKKAIKLAASAAGKSFDDFVADMNKTRASRGSK